MQRNRQPAPDFTNTCLIMGLCNLLWIFRAIWMAWGLITVFFIAYVINRWIKRIPT